MVEAFHRQTGQSSPEGEQHNRHSSRQGRVSFQRHTASKPPSLPSPGSADGYAAYPEAPREDSPLLGNSEPVVLGREEKTESNDWDISVVSGYPRVLDLTGGGGGGGARGTGSAYGSEAGSRVRTVSADPTTISAADETLLGTFMEVMSEGESKYTEGRFQSVVSDWSSERSTLVFTAKIGSSIPTEGQLIYRTRAALVFFFDFCA